MTSPKITRRDTLKTGSAAIAIALAEMSMPDFAFPGQDKLGDLVPFLNMPRARPQMLDWETLDSWITPQDQVFGVSHYGVPKFDPKTFKLQISGLVDRPQALTLEQIQGLPKKDQLMTLECSGNGASKGFMSAIYNSKWTGTPLASLLKSCGIKPQAKEVVFFGVDQREETIRKGTPRERKFNSQFARSLSVDDAMSLPLLLAYQRNGKPLELRNGAPLRLIVPGWYGIANVKWLTRIELRNRRFVGRFMGRDYVTLRGERHGQRIDYVETSVSQMNLKSIIARVTRRPTTGGVVPVKAYGAAWNNGTAIGKVEVKVGEGKWVEATLDKQPRAKYSWTFFSIDLGNLKPGKHTLVSRAIDVNGRVQPSAKDDEIALKKTYWEAYQQWPREIELKA
ncbi:MAG: hypothetical protein CMJ65_16930 [Planctomycetaceae bacterium]|jgi:DMSO/TMAO reductase YedYZ molybdopterin-dependent catalytic subunit|nr:hypothetical protein [Planctomycetaceae bacterium]MDP7277204.1 molybdopterin-dependent oxidoreductase [Planctomycetaceae bacterium]